MFVCLSVCLSVSERVYFPNYIRCNDFHRYSPTPLARLSFGGVAIRWVLPVLWMTSYMDDVIFALTLETARRHKKGVCSKMTHHGQHGFDIEVYDSPRERTRCGKKVAHTRLPSAGSRSWFRFFAVSLQLTWVISPAVGCHYFPPGPQLPPQPLRGLLPILLLGEQRHNGCKQFA